MKAQPIPITIHAQHSRFNINPADKTLEKINIKAVEKAQAAADITNSDIIILHPGTLANKNCSIENAINFFKKINDPRIIIENLTSRKSLCRLPKELVQSFELIPELDDKEIKKDDNSHIPRDWKLELNVLDFEKKTGEFKIVKR